MRKAFVFDFDDTLATTKAVVRVQGSDNSCVGTSFTLTPAEFNSYQLKKEEQFDFADFRCPHLIENGNPTDLIKLASDVCSEEHAVYILTARSSDMADAIAKLLHPQPSYLTRFRTQAPVGCDHLQPSVSWRYAHFQETLLTRLGF